MKFLIFIFFVPTLLIAQTDSIVVKVPVGSPSGMGNTSDYPTMTGNQNITNKTFLGGNTWNGNVIGSTYGGTGLNSIGTGLQYLRVNAGGTALEYANFAHTHIIGDITSLQPSLDGKENTITAGTTAQYWRGDKTFQTLNSASVGLGSVNNTSDADKPVSTATQTALDGKQNLDADLTTIAGLTATTDNFIVSVTSAWASRTPAQVKTTLALNNVENTALSTWAGTTNITTVGTINTGTWNATTIGTNKGGTGLTSIGTPLQILRVNAGGTALEYADNSGGGVPTTRAINTTLPLAGGGDLSADRTLTLNINGATSTTVAIDDEALFGDVSNSNAIRKTTIEDIVGSYNRYYRPVKRYDFFSDFIGTVSTTTTSADVFATNSGTGAATSAQATDNSGRIGLVRSTTGTTATGRTAVTTNISAIRLGGGTWVYETYVNIATLSTSAERYQLAIGFIDATTAANQVDGAYILYDEGGVSTGSTAAAYWQTVTTSNSVRTFNTSLSQVTVSAATWVKLRIEVNAAASSITFYVNGSAIATHTANIPTAAGRETGFGWLLIKSVGTTARTVDFDYIAVQNDFTNDR